MVRQIVVFALLVMMLASIFATTQKARQSQMAEDYILPLKSHINTIGPRSAQANQLTFSFSDPVGDQSGTVDLTGMTMNFDNATGNYNIVLTATAANPFVGTFRINVNLFNPDTTADDCFFNDNQKDFNLTVATTSITLTGTNSKLLSWKAGDRVAISSLPFGNPPVPGVGAFASNVLNIPFGTGEDRLAFDAAGFTTISLAFTPSLTCPPAKTIRGCNLSGIGSLAYSEAPVMITEGQLQAEGGNVSAPRGIASITYQDSQSGSCPNLRVSRMFTLTDVCGNATSCQQTINFGLIGSEVVVPNSLAAVEGNSRNFIPFFTFTTCYQQVYNSSQFSFLGPRTITKIAFRPDFESGQRPFQITLSNVEIRLSTTTRSSDGLNFFCVNAGQNEKIVRLARELTLRSSASGAVGGPRDFDVVIRIAPFRYDPAKGNLLLEIRNTGTISSGFQNTFMDASNVLGDPVSRVWQERGPFTSTKDTIGLVTKFFFAEPQ
jgi:hypothetical protein